jgi:hypothetical protein
MSYQVKIDPSATAELDEVMGWYEGQKAGLGVDFLLRFYNAVAEAEKEVVVLAVWHTSQDPDRLQKRLG